MLYLINIEAIALLTYFVRDTFAGALRFYLDILGLGPVWFIPDLLALLCMGVFSYRSVYIENNSVAKWLIAYVPFALIIGYFFLESLPAVFSSLKMFAPVFVGFCFYRRGFSSYTTTLRVIYSLLYISIIGIVLSSYMTMPWTGYNFESFGVSRQSTRVWWTEGELRLSGFAADSTMAAFFVMIPFIITSLRRGLVWCLVMGAVSLYAIDLTTNKTAFFTLSIYLVTLLALRAAAVHDKINALRRVATASFLCTLIPLALMLALSGTDLASMNPTLFSLQDRINNSWQNPFIFMAELMPTGFLSGCGLGCFNYPQEVFNAKIAYYVPVDNFYIGTLLMFGPIFIVFVLLVIQAMQWTDDPYKLTIVFVMNIFTVTVLSYGPASGLVMLAFGFSDVFAPAESRRPVKLPDVPRASASSYDIGLQGTETRA